MLCPPLSFSLYFPAGCSSIQSWIQVCETAGRKVLYLSQMWNTHSFACWKIWQEIHLSPDWLRKCRPCESTYLNGELANNIFWDLPTNHYYWQHTATDLHLLPHHSHKLPQVAVPKDPFCSQHLRISCPVLLQLLCLSLSSITSFQQQQPTYAHQRSFSLLNTAAD